MRGELIVKCFQAICLGLERISKFAEVKHGKIIHLNGGLNELLTYSLEDLRLPLLFDFAHAQSIDSLALENSAQSFRRSSANLQSKKLSFSRNTIGRSKFT